jgi:hypothetical protein
MTKNYWLDLCFDMMESYIPKDIEAYDNDYKHREKYTEICFHAENMSLAIGRL